MQLCQFPRRSIQRLRFLAKCEAHLLCSVAWIAIKARTRHRCQSNLFHQILSELDIIVESERGDIGHHVVRAPGKKALEPRGSQRRNQTISPYTVSLGQ